MKEFLKNLTSIEEHKQSVVSYAFILFCMLGAWKGFRVGDIPSNMMYLIEFLGTGILGYNVAKPFLNKTTGGDSNAAKEQQKL